MNNKKIFITCFITSIIFFSLLINVIIILNFKHIPILNNYISKKVAEQSEYQYIYGVFDVFGESYKDFIIHNNTPELLKKLYRNLDKKSIKNLDMTLNAIIHLPDGTYSKYFLFDGGKYDNDYRIKHNIENLKGKFEQELPSIIEKYKNKLPKEYFSDLFAPFIYGVLFEEHNLRYANDKMKNYIKNKIFIDGGAYVGDSAIVLCKYEPIKIYSFEISDINIKRFNETMQKNNIDKNKVELIPLAISDDINEYKITGKWEMEGIISSQPIENGVTVKSTDIDSFMKNKKGQVGFIKADLQGIMHRAITGMKETIKRDRPVLLLDISDSPRDFFYTKPILEDIVKDLNYTIKITNYNSTCNITGTSIWAYPKELDEE